MARRAGLPGGLSSGLWNVALLIAGFGIGQGAVFVAQTWLLAGGRLDLLAAFGTHMSFAVLGMMVVDGGTITILARHTSRLAPDRQPSDAVWRLFWDATAFRAAMGAATLVVAIAYAAMVADPGFARAYMLAAAPAFVIWAFNASGLLDGLTRSGISGLTGCLPYATSAIALPLALPAPPDTAGAVLGAAFTVGCALTVAAQAAALRRQGWTVRFVAVTRDGFVTAARDGAALLGAMLPGQVYFRIQLVLSTALLGTETTALLLYAKQVTFAFVQVIGFAQRAEFPGLVQRIRDPAAGLYRTVFGAQKLACALAVASTAVVVAGCLSVSFPPGSTLARATPLLTAFAPTILTVSALLIVAQGLTALGEFVALARYVAVSIVVGLAVGVVLLPTLGVYAFIVGDIASNIAAVVLFHLGLRRHRRAELIAGAVAS